MSSPPVKDICREEIVKTLSGNDEFDLDLKTEIGSKLEQGAAQQQSTRSKSERQRRKNEKLKEKQRTRPDFQRKMKRPIYYRYNYRKVRAQLAEDQIYTSHQLTINYRNMEVLIGFKSKEQEDRARQLVKIDYFSRSQYFKRWGW